MPPPESKLGIPYSALKKNIPFTKIFSLANGIREAYHFLLFEYSEKNQAHVRVIYNFLGVFKMKATIYLIY